MDYVYEAILEWDDDGYTVSFPQIPEAVTFGSTREEAVKRAHEVLTLSLAERLEEGEAIPEQEHTAEIVSIAVNVDGETIDASKCLTMEQAAEELGVTPGRISQLASSGKLQPVIFGKRKMVTIASVNERKKQGAHAGRPRKAAVKSLA